MDNCRWMERSNRFSATNPDPKANLPEGPKRFDMPISEADFQAWKAAQHGDAARKSLRPDIGPLPPKTISALPLEPLYVSHDVDAAALAAEAIPGKPPFTRGIHAGMYRQRLWTFRQY